eukprot:SAG11_NODE_8253_length_1040_cov_1.149841_1_plen_26_part_10
MARALRLLGQLEKRGGTAVVDNCSKT